MQGITDGFRKGWLWSGTKGSQACMVGGVSTKLAKAGEKGRMASGGSSWYGTLLGRFRKTKVRVTWGLVGVLMGVHFLYTVP